MVPNILSLHGQLQDILRVSQLSYHSLVQNFGYSSCLNKVVTRYLYARSSEFIPVLRMVQSLVGQLWRPFDTIKVKFWQGLIALIENPLLELCYMYICDSHTGRPHMHELSFFNLSTLLRVFIDSCHFTRSIQIFLVLFPAKFFS